MSLLSILILLFTLTHVLPAKWSVYRQAASKYATKLASICIILNTPCFMDASHATPTQSILISKENIEFDFNDLSRLKKGLKEIDYLLNNWDEKTLYCNFGEFQRELLTPENKEKLFIAAKETGLLDYDKSKTMNIMCKRDPQMVRALLGLTSDNLNLNNAEKLLRKSTTVNLIDPDNIDEYFELVDKFSMAISSADTLAYEARTDFGSIENANKQIALQEMKDNSSNNNNNNNNNGGSGGKESYLDQSKKSVVVVRDSLQQLIELLHI